MTPRPQIEVMEARWARTELLFMEDRLDEDTMVSELQVCMRMAIEMLGDSPEIENLIGRVEDSPPQRVEDIVDLHTELTSLVLAAVSAEA